MNRTHKTLRNSAVSLLGQVLSILLSFVSRKVFIQYLGVEMLGLNSTFASLLSTLSLAELGFQQVIVFHLYGVLAKGDREQINSLVNIYRLVYRCIGCFFVAAALCCVPFLQYILSDIEATPQVRLYFLIQALTGACTYFLAYKRNILFADQSSYISGLIDTVVNTTATILCILAAVYTRSYTLYLLIHLVKTYLSNLIVHIACTKRYPYLHSAKLDWPLLRKIVGNLKDVVLERIAGYIYGSTDNLLISVFISTVQVGFLGNYTVVISSVKQLIQSLSGPLVPAIGNLVAEGHGEEKQMQTFRLLEQGHFWLTGLAVVPVYVLSDRFVAMLLGEGYVIPRVLLFLMCVDMYVHINQGACLSFLNANGLFETRRNISIAGAGVNVVVSALLIRPFGIAGILAGTAVSQLYYWAHRSVVALRTCLKQSWGELTRYWLRQIWLLAVITASVLVSEGLVERLLPHNTIAAFLAGGILCEAVFCLLALVCCRWIPGQRQMEQLAGRLVTRRLGKQSGDKM